MLHVWQVSGNGTNPSTFAISPPLAQLTNERREPPDPFGDAQPFRFGNSGQSRSDLEGHGRVLLADGEGVIAGANLSVYQKVGCSGLTTWFGIFRDQGRSVDLCNGCVLQLRHWRFSSLSSRTAGLSVHVRTRRTIIHTKVDVPACLIFALAFAIHSS